MNFSSSDTPSFWRRHSTTVKEIFLLIFILLSYTAYRTLPPVRQFVDKLVNPTAAGLTVLYGKGSTFVYRFTGWDLGFVSYPPDEDFLYRVRLATYINQRAAEPLLSLAMNSQLSIPKREAALMSLLKFDSASEWVEPFLNKLPQGGLLGLYDDQTDAIMALAHQIREEGGIKKDLVQAYAEVAFSFMLNHVDDIIRQRGLELIPYILPEEAWSLLVPRLSKETEPALRDKIEETLWRLEAVSDPGRALLALNSIYQTPPWPEIRAPLAVALARLGHPEAQKNLKRLNMEVLSPQQREAVRIALIPKPYPRVVSPSHEVKQRLAERQAARQVQYAAAFKKQETLKRQERLRQQLLARATPPATPPALVAPQKTKGPTPMPVTPKNDGSSPEQIQAKEQQKARPSERQRVRTSQPSEQFVPSVPVERPVAKTPRGVVDKPVTKAEKEKKPKEPIKSDEYVMPPVESPEAETFPLPEEDQVASLPKDDNQLPPLPPIDDVPPMRGVDVVFEVKDGDVSLYDNPGGNPTGAMLAKGTKGKAEFEVTLAGKRWYQVRSKKGEGWVEADLLTAFNLMPEFVDTSSPALPPAAPSQTNETETYFKAAIPNVPVFDTLAENAKQVGVLEGNRSYLAKSSGKIGADRWFQLELEPGVLAWAEGINLQLADFPTPTDQPGTQATAESKKAQSAFAAEWVTASVKGVGVYNRPSIAGKMVFQISPPEVYKVVEAVEGSGKEWYRIQIGQGKEGWVQALDVSLTTPK